MIEEREFVFISYKSEEVEYARAMREAIASLGYSVWWDQNVQTSGKWNDEIDRSLENAAAVVVLWSRRSVESKWVAHEASSAIARGVLIPCKIEAVEIPAPFDRYQSPSLVGWEGSTKAQHVAGVFAQLESLLGTPPEHPTDQELWHPWPKNVPRSIFENAISWSLRNAVGLLGVIVALLILALVVGIPSMQSRVRNLSQENSRVISNAVAASKETENLRSGVKAILSQVRLENERVIVSIPDDFRVAKTIKVPQVKDGFPPRVVMKKRTIEVTNKSKIVKDITEFQAQVDELGAGILEKIDGIERLFNDITSESDDGQPDSG